MSVWTMPKRVVSFKNYPESVKETLTNGTKPLRFNTKISPQAQAELRLRPCDPVPDAPKKCFVPNNTAVIYPLHGNCMPCNQVKDDPCEPKY